MNEMVMKIQYFIFMTIFFVCFVGLSVALMPVAYFMGVIDKIKTLSHQKTMMMKVKNNYSFFLFGPVILGFDLLADMNYFWVNNFREMESLKQIIIVREKSTVTHQSIKEILAMNT
jgi:hypothetical protein